MVQGTAKDGLDGSLLLFGKPWFGHRIPDQLSAVLFGAGASAQGSQSAKKAKNWRSLRTQAAACFHHGQLNESVFADDGQRACLRILTRQSASEAL